jgi:hypothetical protein
MCMSRNRLLAFVFLWCGFVCVRAHAGATLLLEEPYSVDGTFAGTGHTAVYLDRVCADTPLVLRRCTPGEVGVVISRYHGVAGYDWLAMPLIPYLYAVDSPEKVPLYADPKLETFLRDRYRRTYLESIVPDGKNGETPDGPWYQLVGSAYDRTLYAFQIETSAEKDDELIQIFNARQNVGLYKLLSANCADFAKGIINFYYPGALHRAVIADLGVTTPKQIAKCLVHYSKHRPQLELTSYIIPQVPGTIKRSRPVRGIVESAFKAKKYMVPLLAWHPAIVAGFAAAYFTGRGGFDPAHNALVFNLDHNLQMPLTAEERREYQKQLEKLSRGIAEDDEALGLTKWSRVQATAVPDLDQNGQPLFMLHEGDDPVEVGLSRKNILREPGSSEVARQMMLARLREELHRGEIRISKSDVSADLQLLQELNKADRERSPSPDEGGSGMETASKVR